MDLVTAPPTWRFPAGEMHRLDNGLRVRLVDRPGHFVATVAVVIDLPTEAERADTEGVVAAWSALVALDDSLADGSGAGAAARLGARVTTGCDHRGPKLMADCVVDDVPELLEVLAPALLDPHPSATAFDLVRRRRTAELDLELRDPFALANKLFNESVLDPGSRYARPVSGTVHAWSMLQLDDVLALHAAHVDPARFTVTVVGDLGGVDVARAAQRTFGRYPARGRAPVGDRAPAPGGAPALTVRPGGEAAQTQLLVGCWSVDRIDLRWPAARVLADLLGGLDGPVNRRVRGELGLSYGLDVRFLPYVSGGTFAVSGKVAATGGEIALRTVFDAFADVHAGAMSGDEFVASRDRLVDSAPQVFESTLGVAQQHGELDSCGLMSTYIDAHLAALADLDLETFRAHAASLVDPAAMHAVVVGEFDADASFLAHLARR